MPLIVKCQDVKYSIIYRAGKSVEVEEPEVKEGETT